jgi:aflatoxin B1 aldehyde reductase
MYLLHVPDDKIPISETMDGIQALYLAGHFTHFGLSNFSAAQVEECHMYATKMGYILPSTYQSIYSPLNRVPEATLFPLLRRLGISIQAYSCLGSGFLVRSPTDIQAGKGNFDHTTILGKVLQDMYGKDSYLNFLEGYGKLAEEAGLNRAGMAYRWVVWNSKLEVGKGDKVLLGASCPHQLDQTMIEIQKGPLEDWVVKRLGLLWESVQADAPEHNFATYKKLLKAGLL